jgi:hypothetical protein
LGTFAAADVVDTEEAFAASSFGQVPQTQAAERTISHAIDASTGAEK